MTNNTVKVVGLDYKFHQQAQKPGESVQHKLVATFDFGNMADETTHD